MRAGWRPASSRRSRRTMPAPTRAGGCRCTAASPASRRCATCRSSPASAGSRATSVRAALGLPPDRPLVLVSLGGYGARGVDLHGAAASLRGVADVVATSYDTFTPGDGVHRVDETAMYGQRIRYEDLVGAVDVVASKPGYGIISDCAANAHGAALHGPRPLLRVRRAGAGDAALCGGGVHRPGGPAGRTLARRRRRAAGASAAGRGAGRWGDDGGRLAVRDPGRPARADRRPRGRSADGVSP